MKLRHISLLCDPETHGDLTIVDVVYNGVEIVNEGLISITNQSMHRLNEIESWLQAAGFAEMYQRKGNDFVGVK